LRADADTWTKNGSREIFDLLKAFIRSIGDHAFRIRTGDEEIQVSESGFLRLGEFRLQAEILHECAFHGGIVC
jgi:hypothetical protein